MANVTFGESPFEKFLFGNTKTAVFWLLARVYVGWVWLEAGFEKVNSDVWSGSKAGTALTGFIKGALVKTSGEHPDVSGWYAWFLEHAVLPHAALWSHVVANGEVLVGVALILGAFVGIAAFFGAFMNLNFLLSGAVSVNPVLFTLAIGLILAWKVAGYYGLDYLFLPFLGTPWRPGNVFKNQ